MSIVTDALIAYAIANEIWVGEEVNTNAPKILRALIKVSRAMNSSAPSQPVAEVVEQDPNQHGYPRAIKHLKPIHSKDDLLPAGTKLYTHSDIPSDIPEVFLNLLEAARRVPNFTGRGNEYSISDSDFNDAVEACDIYLAEHTNT